MKSIRDLRLDGLKYFLICLVVLMHCAQGGRYNDSVSTAIYSTIYGFHMPLFVMLSGYFFHSTSFGQVNKSNLKILEPLLVYHLFSIIYLSPINWLIFEPDPLWYLVSLICWRYLAVISFNIFERTNYDKLQCKIANFIFSLILSLMAFVLINKYETVLSVMRTFQFFPFFMMGLLLKDETIHKIFNKPFLKIILVVLGIASICIFVKFSGSLLCAINFNKYGIYTLSSILHTTYGGAIWLKYAVNLLSLLICFAIFTLFKSPRIFSENGSSTLFILCAHIPFYYVIKMFSNFYLGMFLGVLVILFLTFVSNTKYKLFLLNPLTTLYNKYAKKK